MPETVPETIEFKAPARTAVCEAETQVASETGTSQSTWWRRAILASIEFVKGVGQMLALPLCRVGFFGDHKMACPSESRKGYYCLIV